MDFGCVGDYFELVLYKRLSGTDIDRNISHGHELGGFAKLSKYLGTSRARVPARYVYVSDSEATAHEAWTTWYDSRENDPNRSPEWRLYYPDCDPTKSARAGDLTLTCLTRDGSLVFLFVAQDSDREADVTWLFGLDGDAQRFTPGRDMRRRVDSTGAMLLALVGIEVSQPPTLAEYEAVMIERWPDKFPSGRDFSSFAREATGVGADGVRDDPDGALVEFYNTQTVLFMAYEQHERERCLGPLVTDVHEPDYESILEVAMSLFQRRRSAAGHALEYHLEAIFKVLGIRYSAQKVTENKEKPDFLFPSVEAYHDRSYPAAGLTLLGAKTTAKDRWRQVLEEGERVDRKHLITLQPAITDDQLREICQKLQLVIPAPIQETYKPVWQTTLWTMSDFCAHVLDLQIRYYDHVRATTA